LVRYTDLCRNPPVTAAALAQELTSLDAAQVTYATQFVE
jgi:hypothetical protein